MSIPNEDSYHLMVLPHEKQDLDPSNGTTEAGFDSMDVLTWEGGTQDSEPAVSPDGNTVAFVRKDATDVPPSLWLVNIDGTHEHPITRAPADVRSPAWSPDGSLIAFAAADEPEGRAVYTIRPDGSDLHLVARDQSVADVAWSPDGASIVYSGVPYGEPVYFADLWVASPSGADPRPLTQTPDVGEREPTWSPDGSSIAFVADDGIHEMPAEGGPSQVIVPWSPGGGPAPASPSWSPDGAYLTFVRDAASPSASVVYVLPVGESDALPLAQGSSFAWQPIPFVSRTPSISTDLGLDFPICRVTSMPITVAGTAGNAYVFSEVAGRCPKAGEGKRFVAADLNGDGIVDTPPVQLDGCFPPVGCETFAAPDVNGDGTSEIAVSNAGADGYGVRLYAITTAPPAIQQIVVAETGQLGYVRSGPVEFPWVSVATHVEGATCDSSSTGLTLTIFGYTYDPNEKLDQVQPVQRSELRIDGTTATVTEESNDSMSLVDAPAIANRLCGSPLYGSAANFPDAVHAAGTDIGLDAPLCDVSDMTADVTGDQQPDTIWVGVAVQPDGRCPDAYDAENVVAVDVTGDGLADTSSTAIAYCVSCAPFGTIDFDADGTNELIVTEQAGSEIQYGVFAVRPTGESGRLQIVPVLLADPGDPKGGFDGGKPFTFWAGGDEGRDDFVRCDSYPDAPVMVLTQTSHPIEGPGSETKTVHITRLQLEADGLFHVSGVDEYTQSTSDATTFPKPATACGLRLDLYL